MNARNFLLGFGAICISGSVVCAYLSIPNPPEGFFAVKPIIDMGDLEQGQTAQAEFDLVNRFRQPLQITAVRESCSCSTTGLEKRQLKTGEHTKLTAIWKTGSARGQKEVDLGVEYILEDGTQGWARLTVRGVITPDIHYSPDEIIFEGGVSAQRVVHLRPGRMKDFAIKSAYVSHRAFQAAVNAGQKRVTVVFDPSLWRNGDDAKPRLTVVTDSPRQPFLLVDLDVANHQRKE